MSTIIRPDFGKKQVRCRHRIKVNSSYYIMSVAHGMRENITISAEPYIYGGEWWFNVCGTYNVMRPLSEYSVIADTSGLWNELLWLSFSDANPYSATRECNDCSGQSAAAPSVQAGGWRHPMELFVSIFSDENNDLGFFDSYKSYANRWAYWQWKISGDETLVDMICASATAAAVQAEIDPKIDRDRATLYGKGIKRLIDILDGRKVRSVLANGWWCLEVKS